MDEVGEDVAPVGVDVALFGRLCVRGPGGVLDDRSFPSRKAKVVFEVLALAGGLSVSKQQLVTTVWRDRALSNANATVENTISLLRKALSRIAGGLPVILTTAGGYALNTAVAFVDLARFDELVRGASQLAPSAALDRLTEAVGLAAGAVLEDVKDAWWVVRSRDEYRLRVETATLDAARLALAADRPDVAIEFSHRFQRTATVLCEEAFELEVAALLRLDRRVDGHLRLRDAELALRAEFGTGLGPELVALRDLLRAGPGEPDRVSLSLFRGLDAPLDSPRFVGRVDEVDCIVAVIGQVAAGENVWVLIEGHRGSGKSSLLTALEQQLALPVLRVNCRFADQAVPFLVATQLAELLNTVRLAPGTTVVSADPTELFELLANSMSLLAPLVVLVDDVHLIDVESATILDALTGPGGAPGCAVIASRVMNGGSSGEPQPTLRVELKPLDEHALEALGLPNGLWLTGGHPALAAICLDAWRRGGEFTDDEVARVLARCDEAGPFARLVLSAIAVSETALTVSALAYVTSLWPSAVARTIESAAAIGLVADIERPHLRDEVTRRTLLTSVGEARLGPVRGRARAFNLRPV